MALALQNSFEGARVAVINAYCVLKKRAEAFAPERVVHQRQGTGGEAAKPAFGVHNSVPANGGACEPNGRLQPVAAAPSKINFLQSTARNFAHTLRPLLCRRRAMGLE